MKKDTVKKRAAAKLTTKQKILNCSVHLFSGKGYTETTIREIAEAVGLRESSIYNHFPSKNAILECILEDYMTYDSENFEHGKIFRKLQNNPTTDGLLSCLKIAYPKSKAQYYIKVLGVLMQEQHRNPTVRTYIAEQLILRAERNVKVMIDVLKDLKVIRRETDPDFWMKTSSSLMYAFASRYLMGIGDASPDFSGMTMEDLLRFLFDRMFDKCAVVQRRPSRTLRPERGRALEGKTDTLIRKQTERVKKDTPKPQNPKKAQPSTKRRIFVCAMDLFASNGYTETSVREIAAAVGLRESSIYNHFPSKTSILELILENYKKTNSGAFSRQMILEELQANPTAEGILACLRLTYLAEKEESSLKALCVILHEQYRIPMVRRFMSGQILHSEKYVRAIIDMLKQFHIIRQDTDPDFWMKTTSSVLYTFSSRYLMGIGDQSPDYTGMNRADLLKALFDILMA